MSAEELANRREDLLAIRNEDVMLPKYPIDIFIQETENTGTWAIDDQEALVNAGLPENYVEELKIRAGVLREAESIWFKQRYTLEDAERIWKAERDDAYELHSQLLHHLHFAFRNDEDLDKRVSEIGHGHGNPDMIQGLNDMSVLGKEYQDHLTAINFDLTLLDKAAETADRLGEILSVAVKDQNNNNAKDMRDRAYTYLKEVIDEVRAVGQYVFWRNKERLQGYTSSYNKRCNSHRKRQNKDTHDLDIEEAA